ncbi:MAG: hypothetical protein KIT84_31195 [Labilithrix sp.]|nr:hypothetical protein [Labilithrix sp.]MCW5815535.1 hypothetical protein [Labilithrix sp.]
MRLPKGAAIVDHALVATELLSLGVESTVKDHVGAPAGIANTGSAKTELGVRALAGTLSSVGQVRLGVNSRIQGDLLTRVAPRLDVGATVSGSVNTQADIEPFRSIGWSLQAVVGGVDQKIQGNTFLAPGAYGAVDVKPGATLRLSAGTYFVRTLRVGPGARLSVDTTAAPVLVYATNAIDWKGVLDLTGASNRLLFGLLESGTVDVGSAAAATIIAPLGRITFAPGATYRGSFFAREIVTQPRSNLVFEPFGAWEYVFPPHTDSRLCHSIHIESRKCTMELRQPAQQLGFDPGR